MPLARVPDALRARPFTTATGRGFGVSKSALRSRPWRRIFRDVWAHEDVPDTREVRLQAVALILGERAFVCGLTSAWVYGTDVQDARSDLMWIGCREDFRLRVRPGCVIRELSITDEDLQVVAGVLMTTPLRTAFDCARWLPLVEAIVVADALAHEGLIDRDALAEYARTHRGLRGIRQVDRVVELMDARSESPMETRVRVRLVLDGMHPEVQFEIRDGDGRFVARADFAYPDARLVVEYDGAFHWNQRRADDRRRDAMRSLGWEVLVFSADDYYHRRGWMLQTIRAARRRRAAA